MSQTPTEHQPLEEGALARLTANAPSFAGDRVLWPKGFTFTVEEYCPALKPGDEGYGDSEYIQGEFYYGSAQGGINNVVVPADLVEQVMSAKEMGQRRPPSKAEVAEAIAGEVHSVHNVGFEFDETDHSGAVENATFEAYGSTEEGLRFGVEVQVLRVWEVDF